ncbi:hypothetical protein ACHAXS_012875 [Conticribra weissflogii]
MILVWSDEGGPLQYIGLALFILQFVLPTLVNNSLQLEYQLQFDLPLGLLSFVLVFIVLGAGTAWYCFRSWQANPLVGPVHEEADRNENDGNGNSNSTNNNATNIDNNNSTNDNANNNNNNNSNNPLPFQIPTPINNIYRRLTTFLTSLSPTHLMLASGFVLPISAALPFILASSDSTGALFSSAGSIGIMILAIAAHACMAFAAYGVLSDVLAGTSAYPGNRGRGGGGRRGGRGGRKYSLGEIAEIVRKVPVEEFVSEEDVKRAGGGGSSGRGSGGDDNKGECCTVSVARLKRMLKNRGAAEAGEVCKEKSELVEEILKVRKYNEECAICAEKYEEGDPMRILHCQHEFHLHCFDRWVYTFATESRPDTEPTCPLCKAELR